MLPFFKEILEQPEALTNTLEFYLQDGKGNSFFSHARKVLDSRPPTQIIFTGMGSSFYNSLIPYYYLNSRGVPCDVQDTGEILRYFPPPAPPSIDSKGKKLIIGVSQSGESGELVKLFTKWADMGYSISDLWALTNTPESTLGLKSAITFQTIAGYEASVTSKTYVTGLLLQYFLARLINGEEPCPPDLEGKICQLITHIKAGLDNEMKQFRELGQRMHDFLGDFSFLNFIGQGTAMATVHQATLNLKEVAKVYAEGLTLGMFRHGPIEVIDTNFRAIFIVNDLEAAAAVNPVIANITGKWGKGKVVLISNQPETHQSILNDRVLLLDNPTGDSYLAPIYEIVLLQPFLCIEAETRGFVPGEFRNTHKITK